MFGEYTNLILLSIGTFIGAFTTSLYYKNHIKDLEIKVFEKSTKIQQNTINISDQYKSNFKNKIAEIRSESYLVKSQEEYFKTLNEIYLDFK